MLSRWCYTLRTNTLACEQKDTIAVFSLSEQFFHGKKRIFSRTSVANGELFLKCALKLKYISYRGKFKPKPKNNFDYLQLWFWFDVF